ITNSLGGGGIRLHGDFESVVIENNNIRKVKYEGIMVNKAIHIKANNNFLLESYNLDSYALRLTSVRSGDSMFGVTVDELLEYQLAGSSITLLGNTIPSFGCGLSVSNTDFFNYGENFITVKGGNKETFANIGRFKGRKLGRNTFSGT